MLIDGRKIRDEILEEVRQGVATLPFQPVFCDILVGNDPVLAQYIRMKAKTAESVGIAFYHAEFSETITTEMLVSEIKKINTVPHMCGIILQLPIPEHLDKKSILDAIDTSLDVDCLGTSASDAFFSRRNEIGYPTALACMAVLDSLHIDLAHKKFVVLGQGELVGKPTAHLLRARGYAVETIVRTTENKEALLKNADVIISGIGQGKFLTGDMVKEGSIIIDAGTSESTGGVVGDVDIESVSKIAGYVSPVPGGVGPVTVAMLLKNVLAVAKNKMRGM
jgi:methylenetetrahydrofolate dehydrogenase (NADP+)/methenyltetrahydrofolate cyclohydrolase